VLSVRQDILSAQDGKILHCNLLLAQGEEAMKAKAIRALIEFLNRRYPYLCRDIVIGDKYHIHKNPQKKRIGLAPVEIITSDGLTADQAYSHMEQV
jgi:hypothetical protein